MSVITPQLQQLIDWLSKRRSNILGPFSFPCSEGNSALPVAFLAGELLALWG